jgi:hypothetical protein
MAAVINRLSRALGQIGYHLRPDDVSVSFDYGVSAAKLKGLFRVQGCMDTAIDDPGAAFAGHPSDRHASQSVACVDANANDVAALYELGLNLFERLVSDNRISVARRSCGSKHVQPARGNHPYTKRGVAGINQMDAHRQNSDSLFFCTVKGAVTEMAPE